MKWNEFKKRLQKEAHQEEMEVDVNEIWNGIVDQIEEEQPRRRILPFWFALAGLILMGTGLFFLNQKDSEGAPLAQQTNATNGIANTNQNTALETARSSAKEAIIAQKQNKIEEHKEIQSTQQTNTASDKKNTYSSTIHPIAKASSATPDIKALSQSNIGTSPSSISSDETSINFSNSKNKLTPTSNNSSNKTQLDKTTALQKSNLALSSTTAGFIDRAPSITVFSLLNTLPLSALEASALSLDFPSKHFPFSNLEEAEKVLRKNKQKNIQFSLGIQGGLSAINRSLTNKENEANPLLRIREEFEKPLEATHLGLVLNLEHAKGWRFSSGLQVTNINERYQSQRQLTTSDSIYGVQKIRVNLNGDSIPIMGMILQTIDTIYNKKIFNSYRLIDIPLIIAYQRSFNRWQVGLEAGILINLSLKTKGVIPDENFEDLDLKAQQGILFKNTVGWSYHLGLAVSRPISDQIEIRFSPSARFFPKDFAHQDYTLSQKYWLIGGNLGLHYRF